MADKPAAAQPKEPKAPKAKQEKQEKKDKKPAAAAITVELPAEPEYVAHRIKMWDELKAKAPAHAAGKKISITLPDGKKIEGDAGVTTPMSIALGISKRLAEASIVARVNKELRDLTRPLEEDCSLELVTFEHEDGKKVFWHSSAHLLGCAMERLYCCSLCIGPPLADGGFYYDAAMEKPVSSEDFPRLEALITKLAVEKHPFERMMLPKPVALEMFRHNKYKVEIISSKVPDGGFASAYRCGPLIDLCKGPHVPDTGKIKAFSVFKNSSSYWLGKAENDSLQRVYGISFPDDKLHAIWKKQQEEAAKRDHRNIGRQQELFFFHPYSPGSAFFLPHGTRIYNRLIEFIRAEYRKRGFTEVVTPNVFNKALWETSGHWDKYRENMFQFEAEKVTFALKPMNCPGHCLMFAHRARSYRELPIRFADFGVLHRNELAGALTGLTRVRRFQQDDAHIFCRQDQIRSEITGALAFMNHVYGVFGFEFTLELSTRPENALGERALWDMAEKQLEEALNEFGRPWKLNPGDGAFYGPKIDIHVLDALKRSHQCATIQLDFQLPIRFGLEYSAGEGDKRQAPVIVHRAILGSVERMLAILIEHTAGKWPFWISPRQVAVVPVAEAHLPYARKVQDALHAAGFYVEVDESDNSLNKKIFQAQEAQHNYILVVGEKEASGGLVAVRKRDQEDQKAVQVKPLEEFIAELKALVAAFK